MLDHYGFINTESHLNEWNYLPGNSWNGASRKAAPAEREKYFGAMSGNQGAAFILAALIELQDAPVDMCNFYHGDLGAFGLFNEFGVPQPNYHALEAFSRVARRPRALVRGNVPGNLPLPPPTRSFLSATSNILPVTFSFEPPAGTSRPAASNSTPATALNTNSMAANCASNFPAPRSPKSSCRRSSACPVAQRVIGNFELLGAIKRSTLGFW
jgi:hypothetical protein